MPPSLTVSNTDSLGERIQRALPTDQGREDAEHGQRVPDGRSPLLLADGDHSMVVCGNDAGAKVEVTQLLTQLLGWKDIVDLGDITNARGSESLLPVWVRLMMAFGHANFQFKIVRERS